MSMASLNAGVSAIKSFTKGIEVIGDNIANVATLGFKGSRVEYSDGFANILKSASSSPDGTAPGSNTGVDQVGSGVQLGGIRMKFTQGPIQKTGIDTDLAIENEGFFKIVDSVSGESFATRAGNFRKDDRSFITSQEGFRLQGAIFNGAAIPTYDATIDSSGEVKFTKVAPVNSAAPSTIGDLKVDYTISTGDGTLTNNTGGARTDAEINTLAPRPTKFSFDEKGIITLTMSNGDTFGVGQVLLLNFKDPQALTREGNGRFSGFGAAGEVPLDVVSSIPSKNGLGSLKSGALELSNVDLTDEFANMIVTQRSFQAGARTITVSDELLNEIVNLKR